MLDTLLNPALIVLGGLVLYFGSEWLVEGAAGVAGKFGIKEIVIGLTVVAYGTSAPELAVSISANISGTAPLLFGNVIGSCIANMALILGLTALISPISVEAGLMRRDLPVLLFSAAILPIMLLSSGVSRIEAGFLAACALGYTLLTLRSSGQVSALSEAGLQSTDRTEDPDEKSSTALALLVVVGLALLIGGGELFVRGAKGVALDLGISERVIGLTIVAFGTSVPELATSLTAARKGKTGLAIGGIIGSNIFNIFLVVGASGSIRALPGDLVSQTLDFCFLGAITLFGAFVMRKARTISRLEGGVLLAAYCTFITLTAVS